MVRKEVCTVDIDRALRNMDSYNRDLVKKNIELYNKTGSQSYAREAIAILENFDDSSDVKELIKVLRR